jgi:hypothetical protein
MNPLRRAPAPPILLGESTSPSDYARLHGYLSDAVGSRLLSAGANDAQVDATVRRLLAEAMSAPLPELHRRWLSGVGQSHLMGLAPNAVHIPVGQENTFAMYANRECIADMVMPVVSVQKKSDDVWAMPATTLQSIANVNITNSRARPGEIPYSVNHDLQYRCQDYGLIDFIDAQTIANADAPLNPRLISLTVVKSFLDLAREKRVADIAFASGNYGANTEALSGANRWDQSSSDPIADLLDAKESVYATPNTLVLGGQVWPKLRTNPNVLKYIVGRGYTNFGASPMIAQLETMAQILEVERVLVGRAKYVTSQEAGTTTDYLWGKSAALIRVEPNPNPRMTQTFGYTYRFGSKEYRNEIIPDRLPGAAGGEYLKLTVSDDELVIGGSTTGYLYTTVIS